jgi:hypothetical protein
MLKPQELLHCCCFADGAVVHHLVQRPHKLHPAALRCERQRILQHRGVFSSDAQLRPFTSHLHTLTSDLQGMFACSLLVVACDLLIAPCYGRSLVCLYSPSWNDHHEVKQLQHGAE